MTITLDKPITQGTDFQVLLPASEFLQALRAASLCASDDPMRPILSAVHVKTSENVVTLTATDSYRLARVEFGEHGHHSNKIPWQGTNVSRDFVLPGELVKSITKAFNKSSAAKAVGSALVTYEGDSVTFEFGGMTLSSTQVTQDFPSLTGVIPDESDYAHEEAGFNPVYLATVGKIAAEWPNRSSVPFVIRSMPYNKPAVLTLQGDAGLFTLYLMPVRHK